MPSATQCKKGCNLITVDICLRRGDRDVSGNPYALSVKRNQAAHFPTLPELNGSLCDLDRQVSCVLKALQSV
jgi:hypothetical protein